MTSEKENKVDSLLRRFHRGSGLSDFQLDTFVIAQNGITPWGSFKQILREIDTRREAIEANKEAKLRSFVLRPWRASYRRRLDDLNRRAESELAHLYERLEAVSEELGDLTPERVETLEREYYVARFTLLAQTEIAGNGHGSISAGLLESIAFLPTEDRTEVLLRIDAMREDPKSSMARLQSNEQSPRRIS